MKGSADRSATTDQPGGFMRHSFTDLATAAVLVAAAPASADIRLAVDSDRAPEAGETTCFEFHVTNTRGNAVNNAQIMFMHKRARTTERGVARQCAKPRYPGVQSAFAFKGDERDRAEIRAAGHGGTGVGIPTPRQWYVAELQMPYTAAVTGGRYVGCTAKDGTALDNRGVDLFGIGHSFCTAYPNYVRNTAFLRQNPRQGVPAKAEWWGATDGSRVALRFSYNGEQITGYLPGRGSGEFYVTDVSGVDRDQCGAFYGGTDPKQRGQSGGPLAINVTAETKFGLTWGYTFHIRGELLGVNCDIDLDYD
jgi:hypothetical protein